jgi:hypothetical protein
MHYQGYSVGAVTRLQTGKPRNYGLIWSKSWIFPTSSPNYTTATFEAHPAFYVVNTGGTFHENKTVWVCG